MYTIGRLARRAKINVDSVRFYERQGLLSPDAKTDAGYHLYADDALRRIAFIKHAQRCGFSLSEIREVLQMKMDDADGADVYRLAERKQAEIRESIDSLHAMAAALECLLGSQHAERGFQSDENPLLTALEKVREERVAAAAGGRSPQRYERQLVL